MLNKKLKELFESGHNLMISGAAGTGKSYNIKELIKKYDKKKTFALTSTTGVAAVNINGQTLHSFLNLGLIKSDDIEKEVARIIYNPHANWVQLKNTDVLIIDEISMCDGFLFDIIERVCREKRNNQAPFGGIRILNICKKDNFRN